MYTTIKHEKTPEELKIQTEIKSLITHKGGGYNEDIIEEIINSNLKLLTDVKDRGDVIMVKTAMGELRRALKTFANYKEIKKVTIFGSARTQPHHEDYQLALQVAKQLAHAGFMIITGAGPGIMQAGHEGAGTAMSFGANIKLPWEQNANPIIDKDKKLLNFKYFFTRKLTFLRQSDAIILFPGGFGTLDEAYEALTLMQTGKSRILPLIMLDRPTSDYWKTWHNNNKEHLLKDGLISADDLNLYQMTNKAEDAVKIIKRFYRNYHSSRYVNELLIIRLKHLPSKSAIEGLNEDFSDIITGEQVKTIPTTPAEIEDNDNVDLPRISFGFDRRQHGRLREFINTLNSF